MANWKTVVEKQNAKAYARPKGWDSREDVAEALECSPERVATLLAPGIRSGEVERKEFTVWDNELKRLTRGIFFRETPKDAAVIPVSGIPEVGTRVRSRKGGDGTVIEGGNVQWDTGKVTAPSFKSFKNRDITVLKE